PGGGRKGECRDSTRAVEAWCGLETLGVQPGAQRERVTERCLAGSLLLVRVRLGAGRWRVRQLAQGPYLADRAIGHGRAPHYAQCAPLRVRRSIRLSGCSPRTCAARGPFPAAGKRSTIVPRPQG